MSTTAKCNGMKIKLEADLGNFRSELTCVAGAEPGIYDVLLRVAADTPAALPTLTLSWDLPSVDLHYKWNPRCYQNRALDPSLGSANRVDSSAHSGMPVYCLYNIDGINACTWALSDVTHDTTTGGAYENGKVYKSKAVIHGGKIGIVNEYAVTLRFDFRRIPYYAALRDVARWWAATDAYRPCTVPDAARMPLLSSWYSYNLNIDPYDLERQCALAKDMGMDTVILDDGWQTSQRTFGYQNNGDWEVCTEKFPDFAAHVRRVQALGMKYMVWFSVPFVGIESKAYERFKEKDMLMPGREDAKWFSLDPRFKETRAYLTETYGNFLTRYGIDGFKMDFVDSFGGGPNSTDREDNRRDCVSVGEAVCTLLDEVMARLKAINPDILIEFRQDYVGPAMRCYATMFRAVDCPNSIGDNRVRTLDVRLMCDGTVVHADPITWHDDEPVESAAMQIIHALFSVPQISRKMTELTEPHRRMLRHILSFCREHRAVLQEGELRPLFPHLLYPLVLAKTRAKMLAAFYAPMCLPLDEAMPDQLILVNGSYAPHLMLDLARPFGRARVIVTSCIGEQVADTTMELGAGLHKIPVPAAGQVSICRDRQDPKRTAPPRKRK